MLVSFLVLGQIFTFLMALYLFLSSFRSNIYFPYGFVSFLSSFRSIIYFPYGFIFSFYSSYFLAYLKACYPYILKTSQINKN